MAKSYISENQIDLLIICVISGKIRHSHVETVNFEAQRCNILWNCWFIVQLVLFLEQIGKMYLLGEIFVYVYSSGVLGNSSIALKVGRVNVGIDRTGVFHVHVIHFIDWHQSLWLVCWQVYSVTCLSSRFKNNITQKLLCDWSGDFLLSWIWGTYWWVTNQCHNLTSIFGSQRCDTLWRSDRKMHLEMPEKYQSICTTDDMCTGILIFMIFFFSWYQHPRKGLAKLKSYLRNTVSAVV